MTFVFVWVLGSIVSLMWITFSEVMIAKFRGAAWYSEVLKRLPENTTGWFKKSLAWLVLWPVSTVLWAVAAMNGQSYLEMTAGWFKKQKEKQAEAERRIQAVKDRMQAVLDKRVATVNAAFALSPYDIRFRGVVTDDVSRPLRVYVSGRDAGEAAACDCSNLFPKTEIVMEEEP